MVLEPISGLLYIRKILICYKNTDLDTQYRRYNVYNEWHACIMVLSTGAILCAHGEAMHNSHSYCKICECGKSSIVLRFWVKTASPAQFTAKVKAAECVNLELITCVERHGLDHWESIYHLTRNSRVSLWS